MGQQTIRFRIRPDGRVEEEVVGVLGGGCVSLSERIEAKLGSVRHRQATAEAFQNAPLTAQQPLSNHPSA